MLENKRMLKRFLKATAVASLGLGLVFGTTSCSLFPNPNISNVNLNLSEEKQLQQLFKDSSIQIAKDGGIYSIVDKKYTMNIAYNSLYYPYDVVSYSDGMMINSASTSNESFNSDPLGTLGNTLFDFGVYEFSRENNVYTAKETDGDGVMTITIKNNLVDTVYSKDGEAIYDIRISYKMTDEAIYFFEKVNKQALNSVPEANTEVPEGSDSMIDFGAEPAEEVPTPQE